VDVDIAEILGQLGAAGAVTAVCYWLIERYSKLAETAVTTISQVNEARLKDAQEHNAQMERILAVQVQFMQHIALTATSMKTAADSMTDVAALVKSRQGGKGG
jgi:hypothetical protein